MLQSVVVLLYMRLLRASGPVQYGPSGTFAKNTRDEARANYSANSDEAWVL